MVHCSAWTAVDKAESESELCYKVNALGSENIAKACAKIDAKMVYISTDYVYDGKGDKPFEVDSPIAPLSVYGKTKYQGEEACRKHLEKLFVIRQEGITPYPQSTRHRLLNLLLCGLTAGVGYSLVNLRRKNEDFSNRWSRIHWWKFCSLYVKKISANRHTPRQ